MLVILFAAGALQAGDNESVDQLRTSALPQNREKGAALLGKQGDTKAAKRLIVMLRDKDWGVRMAALRALAPIKFKPGRKAIRKHALNGEIRAIRALAATLLRDHDAKASALVIGKGLKRLKKEARLPAIAALGVIGGPGGIAALEAQMRAPDPTHRQAAARALGRIGAGEKGLLRGLKDKREAVRLLSAAGLARIDTDDARSALLGFLEKNRKEWDAYVLRRIGWHGAEANAAALGKAIAERLPKSKQKAALLQVAYYGKLAACARAALALLGNRDTVTRTFAYRVATFSGDPLLLEQVKAGLDHKDPRVNYAAATAFLESAGSNLVPALRELLSHKRGAVVDVAVRKAVFAKQAGVLPELTALAAGKTAAKKEWKSRVAACVAMGRVAGKAAYDDLAALAKAREWWLRAAAFEGLYHTFDKRAVRLYIDAFIDRNSVCRMTLRRNLRYLSRKRYAQRKMYESWWEKHGRNIDIETPDEQLRKAKKYGYATSRYVQKALKGTDIIAVLGRWDKVQLILEDLKIEHLAIRQQQVSDYGLSPKQVVLVNCEGSVDSEVTRYLQWFVSAGGYMATTDWALVNALARTFPAVLKGYVKQSTGNDVVVVEPAAPKHPILEGVFSDQVALKWWLEIQAFPIAVEDPVRATVLVDSMEMLLRYGSSTMMAEFPAGLGKVIHSTSHFYLQKEGFSNQSNARERMIFAVDHLGISIEDIRKLDETGTFDNVNDTKAISKSYSMFHILVNFIEEKRRIDRL